MSCVYTEKEDTCRVTTQRKKTHGVCLHRERRHMSCVYTEKEDTRRVSTQRKKTHGVCLHRERRHMSCVSTQFLPLSITSARPTCSVSTVPNDFK